jgi:phosphoribosylglycinamide formyltransferase 1
MSKLIINNLETFTIFVHMKRIAIFASGSGTNAQRIIEYFHGSHQVSIGLILSNNPNAYVLERARKAKIPTVCFNRKEFYESNFILDILAVQGISFIVLAGFLWLIPNYLLTAYQGMIINIHPALLPKYGGKGMYGAHVHEAVIKAGDKESGITIHYVNEKYDDGQIIFQTRCAVDVNDTPEILAGKIHELEYKYFPEVIETVILKKP